MKHNELKLVEEVIELPKGSGIDGFNLILKKILSTPKVQKVTIESNGSVHVRRYTRDEEPMVSQLELDTVDPVAIAFNGNIKEVTVRDKDPLYLVCFLLQAASLDQVYPVCFITGQGSNILGSTGFKFKSHCFMGLPIYFHRRLPDDCLLLCTAYGPKGSAIDITQSYKVSLPLSSLDNGTIVQNIEFIEGLT